MAITPAVNHLGRWEERWHPLREEWVILAGHRQDRPWSGEETAGRPAEIPRHDPTCYLCPGNARIGGEVNPQYDSVFVFDNDHPCVGEDAPADPPPAIFFSRSVRSQSWHCCSRISSGRRLS
jgi:UDPglucose--hexose-1-phosphate uridylyltransferase